MIFKGFRVKVIIRLAVLTLFLALFLYFALVTGNYLRSSYFLVFSGLILVELFWFIDKSNQNLSAFFQAILESDFSTTFSQKTEGRSFRRLYSLLNQITDKFREIGAAKEVQLQFLELLVHHIPIGVVSFDKKGTISIRNEAFDAVTGIRRLQNIDSLRKSSPELHHAIMEITPSKNRMIKMTIKGNLTHLSLKASVIKISDEEFKLVSVQDLKAEVEASEIEAWQKLIRVLTHEIMNSVTPITSLTDTLIDILEPYRKNAVSPELGDAAKVYQGLTAIKDRNKALHTFTEAYQSLTKLPKPEFREIVARDLLASISLLLQPGLGKHQICLEISVEPANHRFKADAEQITQAIINLVKNAGQAISSQSQRKSDQVKSHIYLSIFGSVENTEIQVRDEGPGINKDDLEKIFVPFYTTRKSGSGIGLALVRQIIRTHNGAVTVRSKVGEGTTFTIKI